MASRPGPQPTSSTAMPGRRSKRSTMVAARFVFVNELSRSTIQLNHAGHGIERRPDANRQTTAPRTRTPSSPRRMDVTAVISAQCLSSPCISARSWVRSSLAAKADHRSLRFGAGELHHLGPFLGFLADKGGELGG